MKSKEEMEKKYFATYNQQIVFDELKEKGDFVVALQRGMPEQFLQGAGGVKNERNSTIYYVVNQKDGKEMKMVVSSKREIENPTMSETTVQIYEGEKAKVNFNARGVYIDASDKEQLSSLLAGGYPEARYLSCLRDEKGEKLFDEWYHFYGERTELEARYQKYREVEMAELTAGLKSARQFFANFIGSQDDLKIAKKKASVVEKFQKFCKRLALRKKEPNIKLAFDRCTDNNRY